MHAERGTNPCATAMRVTYHKHPTDLARVQLQTDLIIVRFLSDAYCPKECSDAPSCGSEAAAPDSAKDRSIGNETQNSTSPTPFHSILAHVAFHNNDYVDLRYRLAKFSLN